MYLTNISPSLQDENRSEMDKCSKVESGVIKKHQMLFNPTESRLQAIIKQYITAAMEDMIFCKIDKYSRFKASTAIIEKYLGRQPEHAKNKLSAKTLCRRGVQCNTDNRLLGCIFASIAIEVVKKPKGGNTKW